MKSYRPRLASVSQTRSSATNPTTPEHPDALAALFQELADGRTPTFLEMIAALSDISILVTPDGACPDCHI